MGVLQAIIDRQVVFQQRLEGDPELPNYPKDSQQRLQFFATAIAAEAMELLDWTNWKAHKRTYLEPMSAPSKYEAAIEAIDILHYTVNALLELGYTTEEGILELYKTKNAENHSRQDHKY